MYGPSYTVDARRQLDGLGIHAFWHEALKVGIDRAIFGRDLIEGTALRLSIICSLIIWQIQITPSITRQWSLFDCRDAPPDLLAGPVRLADPLDWTEPIGVVDVQRSVRLVNERPNL